MSPVIQGAGGGGKKSGGKITPNNLQSKARARFVELISEGEIFGLVDGALRRLLHLVARRRLALLLEDDALLLVDLVAHSLAKRLLRLPRRQG